MARKTDQSEQGEVNKSELVRDMLTKNPQLKAKEVVAALAEQGVKIQLAQVYFIMGKMGINRRPRVERPVIHPVPVYVPPTQGGGSNSEAVELIKEVRNLANRTGGMENLKELIEALSH